jgi:hypothetical protein
VLDSLAETRKNLEEARGAFASIPAALSSLKQNPETAAAHTEYGKYLCLYHRDWEAGLAHLAHGNDLKWKILARMDLDAPESADQQSQLGDQWYDLAKNAKPWAAKSLQLRAAHWYDRSLAELPNGLHKQRVQKRVREIEESAGSTHLAPGND